MGARCIGRVSCVLALLVGGGVAWIRSSQSSDECGSGQGAWTGSGDPLRFPPLAPRLFSSTSEELALIREWLVQAPYDTRSGPALCHIIRIYGDGAIPSSDLKPGLHAIELLTNSAAAYEYLGEPLLYQTRDGARVRLLSPAEPSSDGESHRDLVLATFAEFGLPLSSSMCIGGRFFRS